MNLLITLLISASYFMGAKAIWQHKYYPSIYSRIIWLLLAINGFASVVALKTDFNVILLAGLLLAGNLVIFLLSLKYSKKIFGPTELISTILLGLSLLVWLVTQLPFLSLTIVLITHFIGGISTYKKVLLNPNDEDLLFWFFFAAGSVLTLINTDRSQISNYLYPLYFALFDGGMTLLCLRRFMPKK